MEIIDRFEGIVEPLTEAMTAEARYRVWDSHMATDPTLRTICLEDYAKHDLDPAQIALDRVFSDSPDSVRLRRCHARLMDVLETQRMALRQIFGVDVDNLVVVLYHGIGNAAGWATSYAERDAVLFGIDKIVELGWDTLERLTDLVAHEIAHVMHARRRGETLAEFARQCGEDWAFRLYAEGVATDVENRFYGRERTQLSWVEACRRREAELKYEYTRLLETNQSCQAFFGDWHAVDGIADAGYYLGARWIGTLRKTHRWEAIMRLDAKRLRPLALNYLQDAKP